MKIVIIGAGSLGSEITAALTTEKHEITVIDVDSMQAESLGAQYDILAVHGNGTQRQVQEAVGVARSDLLIAAGNSDEQNLLACLTARKLGAPHTIARVRNPAYYEQLDFLSDDLGVSLHVNPEEAAAREIARALRLPGVQKSEPFAGGKAELVEMTLTDDSLANGISLFDFANVFQARALICAVKRAGNVIIPNGSFILNAGDRISITASPSELSSLYTNLGLERSRVRNVLIIGEGPILFYLAQALTSENLSVTIMNKDRDACVQLAEDLPRARVLCGDGANQEFLRIESFENYDAVAVLTNDDEDNIITAMYAENNGFDKIAIRLARKALIPVAEKVFNGIIVNPALLAADHIIQYVRSMTGSPGGVIETFYKIIGGMAEAVGFSAWRESKVIGLPLRDLKIKKGVLVACIIRKDSQAVVIPGGDDVIRAGDRVVVVTATHKLSGLDDICS